MASYATLQDAFGVESFGAPVRDEMNGTEHFDGRPVITDARHAAARAASSHNPLQEDMSPHNVYSTREYMTQPAAGPHYDDAGPVLGAVHDMQPMVPYNPHAMRRRTTAKRHDREPFLAVEPFVQAADLVAPLQALPPTQREIVTAGIVGAVVYAILSLLEY